MKDKVKSFLIFFIKVAIIHTTTYIVFGIIFSHIFNYSVLYSTDLVVNFMREYDSPFVAIAPFLQPIRALFIAVALYPLRSFLKSSKLGWLITFSLFLCLSILGTPSAAPGSFEGLIYTKLPIDFQLTGLPEIILQTFAFSVILWISEALPFKSVDFKIRTFILNIARSFVIAFVGVILFSLSGILLLKVLGVETLNAKIERVEIAILSAITLLSMVSSYFLGSRASKNKILAICLFLCYVIIYTVLPYIYNILIDSPYNNYIALVFQAVVSVLVFITSTLLFSSDKKKNVIAPVEDDNIEK